MKMRKILSAVAAVACAVPVCVMAVNAAHTSANAVFCDDGSFATQGMFSQFIPPAFTWQGGGTNPKVEGDEFIGLRLNTANLPAGNVTFVVNASRDLTQDNGAVVVYQYINNGVTTTGTLLVSGAPSNGLSVINNGHNQFVIQLNAAAVNATGVWGDVYFDDQGRTAGVPFTDNVIQGRVNNRVVFPGQTVLSAPTQDCTGL